MFLVFLGFLGFKAFRVYCLWFSRFCRVGFVQGLGFRVGVRSGCGGFPNLGVPFWGPNNKDCSIWGLYWGSPILGNYHVVSGA